MSNFRKQWSQESINLFKEKLYNQFKRISTEIHPNVNWMVDAGVLLGHIREGYFIKTDSDLDLVFFIENLNQIERPFGDILSDTSYKNFKEKLSKPFKMFSKNTTIKDENHPTVISEMYFSFPWNDKWRLCMGGFNNFYLQPSYVINTTLSKFNNDFNIRIPKEFDQYLTYLYKDYKTPSKKYYYKIFLNSSFDFYKRINYKFELDGSISIIYLDDTIKEELDREIEKFELSLYQKNIELF